MKATSTGPLLLLTVLMAGIGSGCDSETGVLIPNRPPNTRISAGPPEATDTGFNVNLFWFGWDDDGFVDHYEIAWETPDDWQGPIFGTDSLFAVQAADSCCVEPLPDFSLPLPDSVYEQFHTFYVRAVDNDGIADETPAVRSFNAKTIAPFTEIAEGSPPMLGQWGTEVKFRWNGNDDDGFVVAYRYALASLQDYRRDTGLPGDNIGRIIAWLDTIQYYPLDTGGYDTDSAVWRFTEADSVVFANVVTTLGTTNKILFGVRGIDNAGATERILDRGTNMRVFDVTRALNGPCIFLTSNIVGTWTCLDPPELRDVFATQGLRFEWRATRGPSQAPIAGFSIAIDDTAQWSSFSPNLTEFPEQPASGEEELWFPDEGAHTLFVRAVDTGGFVRAIAAQLRVFQGPRFEPVADRFVLVVLDTSPGALQQNNIWPINYEPVEFGLIQYYFDDYNIQVHETRSQNKPEVALMNKASSIFWVHGTDVASGDISILRNYHASPPNILPSYVASGGNLLLCGIQPLNATRYYEEEDGDVIFRQNDPVQFRETLPPDTLFVDHWMATQFGIAEIQRTIGNTNPPALAPLRMRTATSRITEGDNPYPDLRFDPLSWPGGPQFRGFGHYDRGIVPLDTGSPNTQAEVIYTFNDSDVPVAIRRLTSPGVNGNLVYLGFHPYFVERPAFRQFIRAVLTDFGEFPVGG